MIEADISEGSETIHKIADVDAMEMPPPNPKAIAAANAGPSGEAAAAAAPASDGALDRRGNPFDPKVHEADEAGNPILGRGGKLKIRRGGDMRSFVAQGRSGSGKSTLPPGTKAPDAMVLEPAAAAPVDYRKVAETWINPALDSVTMTLGSEWKFETDRRERYISAGERLAQRWDVQAEMHPLAELMSLAIGDLIARSELPETKKKLDKVSTWWSRTWRRMTGKPAEEPAAPAAAAAAAAEPRDVTHTQSEGGTYVDRRRQEYAGEQSPRVDAGGRAEPGS